MLKDGFDIVEGVLRKDHVKKIIDDLSALNFEGRTGGIRNIDKKSREVHTLVYSDTLLELAHRYLKARPKLVRAIYFNKTPENNWLVAWHQDKTVAVSNRFNKLGWGPWSLKDGIHHVQPPAEVLNQTITIRVHLDASTRQNGCLRVIPNSHRNGLFDQSSLRTLVSSSESVECDVDVGGVLIMKPHIVHSSSKAVVPSNRRVLHMEYSTYQLSSGIDWA